MAALRINRIEIQGFRAFGKDKQTLSFASPIAAVWGPNSQGKTSLAEAFEFLLTGQIVRRELMASTQDEFADALRNAHMALGIPVYVEAAITGPGGVPHTIKRTLTADYSKKQDCQTRLEIDGKTANEADLLKLGISLSQPPLRAPVLAQHTLGYLFTAKPQDRATYFKALLEVTDLEELRNAVAALGRDLQVPNDPLLSEFKTVCAILEIAADFLLLQIGVPTLDELEKAFANAFARLLAAAGIEVPASLAERVSALQNLLAEKRSKTFPVKEFEKKPAGTWNRPDEDHFDKLKTYIGERANVDTETRRLIMLFKEALKLPALDSPAGNIECPVCAVPEALTPARVELIRRRVADNEAFHRAEVGAKDASRHLSARAEALSKLVDESLPRFTVQTSSTRRSRGFRVERIRALLSPDDALAITNWLKALRPLARARAGTATHTRKLLALLAEHTADLETLLDQQPLEAAFANLAAAFEGFAAALNAYLPAEQLVVTALNTVIDAGAQTAGWQELIALAGDLPALRSALIERAAREDVQKELAKALKEIDKGNEKVLEEKFEALSVGVQMWWDLLRPDEMIFFSAVKPRPNTRRTIDFKAGLSVDADRGNPKLRDVIAVFSQSQLHCLGLSLFLARSVQEKTGFLVLDDPILSSDDDYKAHFNSAVIEKLLDLDMQVVILTQDQRSWKDLENRYLHRNIDMFQISLDRPRDGTSISNSGDDLAAQLSRVETLVRGTHPELRKQAGERLRNAGERFCKMVLVRERWDKGDKSAALSDYDGKTLGDLGPKVEPLLSKDAAHPGKLRSFRDNLNPAKHDDGIPGQAILKVCLGDLKALTRDYLK
jgi:hypothetical protein